MPIPLPTFEIKIFDKRPEPSRDVFYQGVPIGATTTAVQAIILYTPDLESIVAIDNSNCTASGMTTTYTTSTTSGFSFTTTQKIAAEFSAEVNVLVEKSTFKVSLEFGFSEQWNSSHTESVSVSVPPGGTTYLYKGTLRSSILVFDLRNGTYAYTEHSKFRSNIVTSSSKPLIGQAKMLSFDLLSISNGE